jgi:hypothetical protein
MIRIERDSNQMRFGARSLSLRKLISRVAFVYDVRRSTALKNHLELTMARLFNARFVWVLFAIALINASVSMAQTRRGVTPEDYFAFEFISDPNISPDGLKHYGMSTEIVFFPRENHNLTRTGEPKHLVES